jgi:hypothetical protein
MIRVIMINVIIPARIFSLLDPRIERLDGIIKLSFLQQYWS